MERHLVEADEIDTESMICASIGSESKKACEGERRDASDELVEKRDERRGRKDELLVDLEVTCSRSDDGEVETGSDEVSVDVVLVVRVDGEVDDFEDVSLMSLRFDETRKDQLRAFENDRGTSRWLT